MRFLCDEMLSGIARWLRAAGYDTATAAPGERDRPLLERAAAEGRIFVTRDRSILQIRTPGQVWLLLRAGLEPEARELAVKGVDWLHAPFTRCLVDNTPLQPASQEDLQRMPEESRVMPGPHRVCPECRRVYWPGSHVRRMLARLERWSVLPPLPPPAPR